MSNLDGIWNRALDGGGEGDGDIALAAALVFHGLVMNGGALHAVETIDPEELSEAKEGYRWLGLDQVAELIKRIEAESAEVVGDVEALEDLEQSADDDYYALIPDDAALQEALEAKYAEEPDAFDEV
ncbi:DMP19 family protein [Tessaracoccus sp. Y36]